MRKSESEKKRKEKNYLRRNEEINSKIIEKQIPGKAGTKMWKK